MTDRDKNRAEMIQITATILSGLLAYPGGEGFGSLHSNSSIEGAVNLSAKYAEAVIKRVEFGQLDDPRDLLYD